MVLDRHHERRRRKRQTKSINKDPTAAIASLQDEVTALRRGLMALDQRVQQLSADNDDAASESERKVRDLQHEVTMLRYQVQALS